MALKSAELYNLKESLIIYILKSNIFLRNWKNNTIIVKENSNITIKTMDRKYKGIINAIIYRKI